MFKKSDRRWVQPLIKMRDMTAVLKNKTAHRDEKKNQSRDETKREQDIKSRNQEMDI